MNRRMMMQALSAPAVDYLEGYRNKQSCVYGLIATWLTDSSIRLAHTSIGYMGPSQAYMPFIADASVNRGSTDVASAMLAASTNVITAFEVGKKYRFTATVTAVNNNTATADSDGIFIIASGKGSSVFAQMSINLSQMTIGSELVLEFKITSVEYSTPSAFSFGSSGLIKYSFDFDIRIEEV